MKTWTRDEIKNLIETNDLAAMRGVCALYKRQTEQEKQIDNVVTKNFRGFSVATVKVGSEMADWMTVGKMDGVYRRPVGGATTFSKWKDSGRERHWKRVDVCRLICMTHLTQLTKIANGAK